MSDLVVCDWVTDEEQTQEHWLEVHTAEGERSAVVKWDGCIHYNRHYPGSIHDDDPDYLHICDIDQEITYLLCLKQKAIEFFGEDWPDL